MNIIFKFFYKFFGDLFAKQKTRDPSIPEKTRKEMVKNFEKDWKENDLI